MAQRPVIIIIIITPIRQAFHCIHTDREPMAPAKPIELDGRTGEGGGQLIRIAVALAAVCSQPVRITNVRGNRPGPRGGGMYVPDTVAQTLTDDYLPHQASSPSTSPPSRGSQKPPTPTSRASRSAARRSRSTPAALPTISSPGSATATTTTTTATTRSRSAPSRPPPARCSSSRPCSPSSSSPPPTPTDRPSS